MNKTISQLNGAKLNQRSLTKFSVPDVVVGLSLVCAFFILFANPLKIDAIVSLATRTLILLNLFLFVWFFFNKLDCQQETIKALFFLLLLAMFLTILYGGISTVLSKYVSIICFLMNPIYFIGCKQIRNVKIIKQCVFIANIICTGLFVGLYFSDYAYLFRGDYGDKNIAVLTLGYANPNETGMYLLVSFFVMGIAFFYYKKIWQKVVTGFLSVTLLYFIILTDSRMCIILSVIFLLLALTNLCMKIGEKITRTVLLLPLIIAILCLAFPSLMNKIMILGENAVNGRDWLYANWLSSLDVGSFILGDAINIGANLHNSYLSIFAGLGLVGFVVYFMFLQKTAQTYRCQTNSKSEKLAYVAFLCIVMHGIAEATLLVSGAVYSVLVAEMLVLALKEE